MAEEPVEAWAAASRPPPGEAEVYGALRQCFDPCCREKGISVVDMGLIEAVAVDGANVRIDMVLTSGWCPFAMHLLTDMEQQVAALDGVEHVDVNIVWGPAWTPTRLSDDARRKLGEVQREYIAALPPSKRPKPRPARVEESVFPPSTPAAT